MVRKKTVSIITDSYYPATGGMENAILELSEDIHSEYNINIINSLKDNNITGLFKRTVLAPGFSPYKDPNRITVNPLVPGILNRIIMFPIILWHLPLIKRFKAKKLFDFLSFFYNLGMKRKLTKLLINCDLIISYSTSFTSITVSKISKKHNIPLINAPVIHFGKWGDSPAQIKAYGASDIILCPTKHFKAILETYYRKGFPCRTAVVPHLVREKHNVFKKPDIDLESNNFILFIGRRETHKGLGLLISSYKKSYAQIPLVIAGPGEKIKEENNIFDLGKVSEPEKEWLFRNCRFIAVPSKDESFGLVYVEAMSHGKPSLALNVPPIDEILSHNRTALLSVPGDSASLADNILKLSEDNDLLKTLSNNCLSEFHERFSYNKISSIYFRIIKQVINGL